MPRIFLILAIGLVTFALPLGHCDESMTKDELAKKYRGLVQQLVSPNKEATTDNGSSGRYALPKGYDVSAQKRIYAARQTLYDEFEEALPFLVEALDDDRYCMTIDWAEGDAYYNFSVGKICRNMIASHLEVYRNKMRFSLRRWHQYTYPVSKEWWKKQNSRNLVELQIDAINWAIDQCRAEKEIPNQEITDLQKLRDEIAKSRKATKPRRMLPMVPAVGEQ